MLLCKTSNLFDTSFSALSLTISVFGPKQFSYCLKKKSLFFFLKLCFSPLRDEGKKKKTNPQPFLQIYRFVGFRTYFGKCTEIFVSEVTLLYVL